MLESDWLTNVLRCAIIFRETHGECSSKQFVVPKIQGGKTFMQRKEKGKERTWHVAKYGDPYSEFVLCI